MGCCSSDLVWCTGLSLLLIILTLVSTWFCPFCLAPSRFGGALLTLPVGWLDDAPMANFKGIRLTPNDEVDIWICKMTTSVTHFKCIIQDVNADLNFIFNQSLTVRHTRAQPLSFSQRLDEMQNIIYSIYTDHTNHFFEIIYDVKPISIIISTHSLLTMTYIFQNTAIALLYNSIW